MSQMQAAPAISVVVPAYNAAKYVGEAVASVLAQDFTDFELLLVDDGSTDDTAAVLQPFSSDSRVRMLRNERNMGLIATLHRAYAECKAPLIARMDSDDICEPSRFRQQVAFLAAHPDVAIVGGAIRFFGNVAPNVFRFPQTHEAICPAMLFYCPLAHPALMFRRELIDNGLVRYDDALRHAEDYHLWSRLLLQVRSANLPDVVLNYRLHPQQVSSDSSDKQYGASLRVRRQILAEAGIEPSEDEVSLHESVILERPLPRTDYLAALSDWFARLEEANRRSAYWDVMELNKLLRAKFQETARRTGANLLLLVESQAAGRYISAEEASQPAAEHFTGHGRLTRLKQRVRSWLWKMTAAK